MTPTPKSKQLLTDAAAANYCYYYTRIHTCFEQTLCAHSMLLLSLLPSLPLPSPLAYLSNSTTVQFCVIRWFAWTRFVSGGRAATGRAFSLMQTQVLLQIQKNCNKSQTSYTVGSRVNRWRCTQVVAVKSNIMCNKCI